MDTIACAAVFHLILICTNLCSLQFSNEFRIDIKEEDIDLNLQDVVLANRIMDHQIRPDPVSDKFQDRFELH